MRITHVVVACWNADALRSPAERTAGDDVQDLLRIHLKGQLSEDELFALADPPAPEPEPEPWELAPEPTTTANPSPLETLLRKLGFEDESEREDLIAKVALVNRP